MLELMVPEAASDNDSGGANSGTPVVLVVIMSGNSSDGVIGNHSGGKNEYSDGVYSGSYSGSK